MKGLSLIHPADPQQLNRETLRIYEICDGCRRCFNLCPSFNTLLDGIDRNDGDVRRLTPADHRRIEENFMAASVRLSREEVEQIDRACGPSFRWLRRNTVLRRARSVGRGLLSKLMH